MLTTPERYTGIAENIIRMFDETVRSFYDKEDLNKGFIIAPDRNNNIHQIPIMTISIAVIDTEHTQIIHYGQITEIAAELKKLAKQQNGSAFVVDRRSQ